MIELALELVKARIGITTPVRDPYLQKIVEGVIDELENVQGLSLKEDSANHVMFIVDLATWRYENKGLNEGMPRHLQYRLHGLVIKGGRNAP